MNRSLSIITSVSGNSECYEYSGSCKFVKKVLPLAMATLLYNRCEFNETYIKEHSIQNVPYIAFRSTIPKDHCLFPLLASIKVVQELIDKKYLKKVHLVIQSNKEESEKEMYTFTLAYNTPEDESNENSKGLIRAASAFLTNINQLKARKKYPEDEVTILFYWSFISDTPKELVDNFKIVQPFEDVATVQRVFSSFITNYHHIQFSTEVKSNKNNKNNDAKRKDSKSTKTNIKKNRNKRKAQKPKEKLQEANAPVAVKGLTSEKHSPKESKVDRKPAKNYFDEKSSKSNDFASLACPKKSKSNSSKHDGASVISLHSECSIPAHITSPTAIISEKHSSEVSNVDRKRTSVDFDEKSSKSDDLTALTGTKKHKSNSSRLDGVSVTSLRSECSIPAHIASPIAISSDSDDIAMLSIYNINRGE